jgi:hypothetical protein
MNEDAACRADDLAAVAEGQVWQKSLLGRGGAYEVAWDTAAVTPMGSNVRKIVSEDSVRRAFLKGPEAKWDAWLRRHERAVWEPLLTEPYVLDIDNTVKPLYGHQEGAELGYNPKKTSSLARSARELLFIG